MELKNGIKTFYPKSREDWRDWLQKNHQKEQSVWLIYYKKESGIPSLTYSESVDEALCFGWIDSKPNKRDEQSYYRFFSKRNPASHWSKVNKEKVEKLIAEKLMAPSGYEMIRIAKENGSWNALDEVEELVVPNDLQAQFDQNKTAFSNWQEFPPSSKKIILNWILTAKRPETREKRIKETIEKAENNLRANHYRK